MKKRLFVGTFTPIDFKEVKREVERLGVEGKWVEPENLHITFRFIGEVEEEKVPQIAKMLKGSLKGAPPFKVEYRGLGTFKRNGIERVLWVGIRSDEIREIKKRVDRALMPFGFAPEENFTPHLTLLRIKRLKRRIKFRNYVGSMKEYLFKEREERKVYLIESKLTPEGPIYKVVEEFELG
ncbi:RNA 2',3'-cyclic phosphodiesterase [Thermovibrio sp.]